MVKYNAYIKKEHRVSSHFDKDSINSVQATGEY